MKTEKDIRDHVTGKLIGKRVRRARDAYGQKFGKESCPDHTVEETNHLKDLKRKPLLIVCDSKIYEGWLGKDEKEKLVNDVKIRQDKT